MTIIIIMLISFQSVPVCIVSGRKAVEKLHGEMPCCCSRYYSNVSCLFIRIKKGKKYPFKANEYFREVVYKSFRACKSYSRINCLIRTIFSPGERDGKL